MLSPEIRYLNLLLLIHERGIAAVAEKAEASEKYLSQSRKKSSC